VISFGAIAGIPEIREGDDLAAVLAHALRACEYTPEPGDVLVVAQKIVSKAEGRFVDLRTVTASLRACELGRVTGKDARHVELNHTDATHNQRAAPRVLIVRLRLGFVMANAGIDRSNVESGAHEERVLLLPLDCDRSAAELRERLNREFGAAVGVIVSDSFGRAWRNGVVNVALGAAGLPSLIDRRGERDRHRRPLEETQVAFADAVAGAAALVMGEAAEGTPLVLARGLRWQAEDVAAQSLIRPLREDLFQ
jgi:coenzyme F420-0:L-glutamate ligase/coenzyme F420-1:gamma-L-glutamate ligase